MCLFRTIAYGTPMFSISHQWHQEKKRKTAIKLIAGIFWSSCNASIHWKQVRFYENTFFFSAEQMIVVVKLHKCDESSSFITCSSFYGTNFNWLITIHALEFSMDVFSVSLFKYLLKNDST